MSRQCLHAVLLAAVAVTAGYGQAHRAIVRGQVTDVTGAVIPGAAVRVTQRETNSHRTTSTNESGRYEVPGLLPGVYRVEVTAKGLQPARVEDIEVSSAKVAEINLVMAPGEVATALTVTAERQLLDSASADTNTVIDQKKLADLPIGQGNTTYLFLYAAGADSASGVGRGSSSGDDVQPMQRAGTSLSRFNGAPAGTAEFTVDGAPNTQRGNAAAGGGVAFNPAPDMVQEIRIQTSTFDASIGHTGGATVDVVLKSGTNQFHGTAYNFFRDPAWNANSWSANRGGVKKLDFTYRRWGFTGGGPVHLGKLYRGRDRTFFYLGYERWSSISPDTATTATVPTPAMIGGDLSSLLALGSQFQLYDPDSGQLTANNRIQRSPFPRNIIPSSRIHPVAVEFARFWPPPNAPGTRDGQLNFSYLQEPEPRLLWSLPIRIDHNLTDRQKLFGRLVLSDTIIPSTILYARHDVSLRKIEAKNREVALGHVWAPSPSLVADFRGAVMRFGWDTQPIGTNVGYDQLKLGYLRGLFDTSKAGIPSVTISGYSAFPNVAGSRQVSEVRSAGAHFTKIAGRHSVRFGSDLRWYIDNRGAVDRLILSFTGAYSVGPLDNSPPPPIGAGLSDFLLGRFASATVSQPSKASNLSTYQGFYLQDDWKLTPRLTLNLGLRYEREGPPTERFNRSLAGFDPSARSPIADRAKANYAASPAPGLPVASFDVVGGVLFSGADGNPRTLYDSDTNNFAPRIGLAFQLNPDTVLRAGYGIYYIPYGQRFYANEGGVPGFDANTISQSSPDGGLTFNRSLDNLFPQGLSAPSGSSLGLATFLGQALSIPPARPNRNAYSQRLQFSLQRRLGELYRLEARYVHNHTLQMPIARNYRALPLAVLSRSPERDQAVIDYLNTRVANPYYRIPGVGGVLGSATAIQIADLLPPFSQFASVAGFSPQGWSTYHALQVDLDRRFANGLAFQTSYTFSKTMDGLSYLNDADPVPEKVISSADRPHIWRFLGSYELPFGKGKPLGAAAPKLLRYLISGWQAQAMAYVQSGSPILFSNVLFRGNIKDIPISPQTPERMFNVDAGFERAAARQLAFNFRTFPSRLSGVRTGGETNTDFSIIKNNVIREKYNLQFRAEAYNVFNQHFVISHPQSTVNTVPTGAAFGTTVSMSGPRILQLGLRLAF